MSEDARRRTAYGMGALGLVASLAGCGGEPAPRPGTPRPVVLPSDAVALGGPLASPAVAAPTSAGASVPAPADALDGHPQLGAPAAQRASVDRCAAPRPATDGSAGWTFAGVDADGAPRLEVTLRRVQGNWGHDDREAFETCLRLSARRWAGTPEGTYEHPLGAASGAHRPHGVLAEGERRFLAVLADAAAHCPPTADYRVGVGVAVTPERVVVSPFPVDRRGRPEPGHRVAAPAADLGCWTRLLEAAPWEDLPVGTVLQWPIVAVGGELSVLGSPPR